MVESLLKSVGLDWIYVIKMILEEFWGFVHGYDSINLLI